MSESFPSEPARYLELLRREVPRYDELEDAAIDAIPFAPERVLELGIGTGETTRRLIARWPEARVTALDADPEMIFRARDLAEDVRLARMEDPLPDGPWDLVIAVLAVHHLTAPRKRDLFRRVREQSRSLVLGDVVRADPQITRPDEGVDFYETAEDLAAWSGGEVVWRADDLAVVRAQY